MSIKYDSQLRARDREFLERNGVSPEAARSRGYSSLQSANELRRHGFTAEQRARAPGLLAPIYDAHGNQIAMAFWPDTPRFEEGILRPLEIPPRTGTVLDISPVVRERVADVGVPLYVTDSVVDADAAISRGLCAVALLGGKSLNLSLGNGPADALRDVPLVGRSVFLCFANDAERRQPGVLHSARQLFENAKSVVSIVAMPKALGPAGGIAALLSAGASAADVAKLALVEIPVPTSLAQSQQFIARKGEGMVWLKVRSSGTEEVLLANFTACVFRPMLTTESGRS